MTAGRIVSHKLEGDVAEVYAEENALLLYTADGGEYRVNLPGDEAQTGFDAQRAIVYYDGAATLSIPPQVSAGLVVPVYAVEDLITEIGEDSMTLGGGRGRGGGDVRPRAAARGPVRGRRCARDL